MEFYIKKKAPRISLDHVSIPMIYAIALFLLASSCLYWYIYLYSPLCENTSWYVAHATVLQKNIDHLNIKKRIDTQQTHKTDCDLYTVDTIHERFNELVNQIHARKLSVGEIKKNHTTNVSYPCVEYFLQVHGSFHDLLAWLNAIDCTKKGIKIKEYNLYKSSHAPNHEVSLDVTIEILYFL